MKKLAIAAIVAASFVATQAAAQNLTVTVTNLTNGMAFTPVLVVAHDSASQLYQVGQIASPALQAMAEGGDLMPLITDLGDTVTQQISSDAADGSPTPLLAGASTTVTLNTDNTQNTNLSVVSMLLPTNDAFMALNAIQIPTAAGSYTYHLSAYDAGTEANNELLLAGGQVPGTLGIPTPPFVTTAGTAGTGVDAPDNINTIHIHRGVLGDDDLTAGISDLDNTVHRWLNPVARVVVIVQ